MAVSRIQTSRIIWGLISNAKPKVSMCSGRKILALEVGVNLQPTTVHQHLYSTAARTYHEPSVTKINVHTDASSRYGFGCVWDKKWAHGSWSRECIKKYKNCTDVLESYAMVVAIEVWGDQWSGYHVTIHCDHHSVVRGFNGKCKFKNKKVKELFGQMNALAKRHNIILKVVIADTDSDIHRGTDGLSKGSLDKFLQYIPQAEYTACKIPGHLDLVGCAYISQQCFIDKLSK